MNIICFTGIFTSICVYKILIHHHSSYLTDITGHNTTTDTTLNNANIAAIISTNGSFFQYIIQITLSTLQQHTTEDHLEEFAAVYEELARCFVI